MTPNTPDGFAVEGGSNTEADTGTTGETATDGTTRNGGGTVDSLTDPLKLCTHDDVTYTERTYTHEEAEHCEAEAAGRVIVGVRNDDGEVLLLVRAADEHVILPNCVVDADADWAAAARRTVEETTGIAVELQRVECLREVTHEVEDDVGPRHQHTTHHVVFRATPMADAADWDEPEVTDDSDWTVGWYDDLPVEPDEAGDVIDDVRMFLE